MWTDEVGVKAVSRVPVLWDALCRKRNPLTPSKPGLFVELVFSSIREVRVFALLVQPPGMPLLTPSSQGKKRIIRECASRKERLKQTITTDKKLPRGQPVKIADLAK